MAENATPASAEERLRACLEQLEAVREEVRRSQDAVRDSEGKFRQVVEASPMGIHLYRLEPDGALIFTGANPAADRILGVDHRQFVGRTIEEAFPALAGGEVPRRYRDVCATGEPWETEQFDYADERIRGAYEVHAFRTAPGRLATLFLDITERKRTELALRDSEEQYRQLVENAGDGIFIAQEGRVTFSNRRAAELAGHAGADEVVNRSMLEFIAPEDHELVRDRHVRRLRGEEVPSTYALRMRRADGTTFWTQLNAVAISWRGRPASLNFIRDISEQRRLEEQLAATERMRSVGTLAGGVAHDFNNILMGIQGNVSLLLAQLDPSSALRPRLEEIERCVESGADLSARILGFAQGGKYQLVPTDLNGLVRGTLEMFGRTTKAMAIRTGYAADLATVEIDRGQIEQVLLNILVNARQAMPGGGELFVGTANVRLDESRAAAAGVGPGGYVAVTVRDTGSGVAPADRGRIFEPFFTTKERGRGTGLGLASAYGIVKHHGGTIEVESEPGRGATFTVLLPASEKPVAPPPALPDGVAGGEGTVLLVDDEEMIVAVGRGLLEHLGYRVLSAGSGEEALRLFDGRAGEIDAVVLDMVMPGLSGGATYEQLRRIDPGVSVLLSSGYSIDSEAREILGRGCDDFIQKPYTLALLSRKLHRLVQQRRERGGARPR